MTRGLVRPGISNNHWHAVGISALNEGDAVDDLFDDAMAMFIQDVLEAVKVF